MRKNSQVSMEDRNMNAPIKQPYLCGILALVLVCLIPATFAQSNRLSAEEKAAGWRLLWDGESLAGYHIYGEENAPIDRWSVEGDALRLSPRIEGNDSKVDLVVSEKPYSSFEFAFEWKMSKGGNGGIFYKVVEGKPYPKPWHTGLEMQLLDDAGHEEGQIDTHRAGDLYDLLAARARFANPAGEWNRSRIVISGDKIEQWMNGKKALSVTIGSKKWIRLVAKSKYSELPDFAKSKEGHIVLQDHGDELWFRNLKIREL